MFYKQDLTNCFSDKVGSNGLEHATYTSYLQKVDSAIESLKQENLELFNSLSNQDEVKEIKEIGNYIQSNYNKLIIIGTGGSSNNAKALCSLVPKKTIQIEFLENIDPFSVDTCFNNIDLAKTAFLVISKSGSTLETLTLTYALKTFLESAEVLA